MNDDYSVSDDSTLYDGGAWGRRFRGIGKYSPKKLWYGGAKSKKKSPLKKKSPAKKIVSKKSKKKSPAKKKKKTSAKKSSRIMWF